MTSSLDTIKRKVPESEFVTYIDETLGKADPEKAIPWKLSDVPDWAKDFQPKVVWDIGCALGAFTESVIKSLAAWGCLANLEHLILFEGDPNIHSDGEDALKDSLVQRMEGLLYLFGLKGIDIQVHIIKISFRQDDGRVYPITPLYMLEPSKADLIIASHLTYYFGDGSGESLMQALFAYHLQSSGKIWCVIRNLECPIYKMRRETLKELDKPDPKPFDYAESFTEHILNEERISGLEIQSIKKWGYSLKGDAISKVGYVFMWREMPPEGRTDYKDAVNKLEDMGDPLFVETHFILGKDHKDEKSQEDEGQCQASDNIFSFEDIKNNWTAASLQVLISEEKVKDQRRMTRMEFFKHYQHSIEYAWILCHAAFKGKSNIAIKECGKRNYVLQLTDEQFNKIKQNDNVEKHRFGVVALILEEIFWHFYSNGIYDYCISLNIKEGEGEGEGEELCPTSLHVAGERNENGCHYHIVIKSADFVRFHINSLAVDDRENGCSWIGEFERDFGWNTDGVKRWGIGRKSERYPPSFLTFKEFTDNLDGNVWLLDRNSDINKLASPDISEKFRESIYAYLKDKKDHCSNKDHSLSICSGIRFSHGSVGDGSANHEGDELLGVFVNLNISGVRSEYLVKIAEGIRISSGSTKHILLQNLAREKAYIQQQDQQTLKKHAQMLRLLERPLNSLTEVLDQTQKDTQELRSILYDPHKTLFSVSHQVEDYFESDRDCHYGMVKWKGMHTFAAGAGKHLTLAKTLAAVVCKIFGRHALKDDDKWGLCKQAQDALSSTDPAYADLRNALEKLSDVHDLNQVSEQLKKCLLFNEQKSVDDVNEILLANLLKRLKTIIYDPFKFSGKTTPLLPLLMVIDDYPKNKECTINIRFPNKSRSARLPIDTEGNVIFSPEILKKATGYEIFNGIPLLVPRYSFILTFISGILSYMKEDNSMNNILKVSINCSDDLKAYAHIVIVFNKKGLYKLNELCGTFETMKLSCMHHLRSPQGNFRKPYIDFAASLADSKNYNIFMPDFNEDETTLIKGSNKARWVLQERNSWLEVCLKKIKIKSVDHSQFSLSYGAGQWSPRRI